MRHNVVGRDPSKNGMFYVYGLYKPDGTLFYVGKGKGSRINQHFNSRSLAEENPKARTIRKYGIDNIGKEIFAYFEEEDDAHELEELVIQEVGLFKEGGTLYNIIPGRYEHRDALRGIEGWERAIANNTKYDEDTVYEIYRLYYEQHMAPSDIARQLQANAETVTKIARGRHRLDLYSKYVESGIIKKNPSKDKRLPKKSIPDEDVLAVYPDLVQGTLSVKEASERLGCTPGFLSSVCNSRMRPHLGLQLTKKRVRNSKTAQRDARKAKINAMLSEGLSIEEIHQKTGHSKSYLQVIRREINNGT